MVLGRGWSVVLEAKRGNTSSNEWRMSLGYELGALADASQISKKKQRGSLTSARSARRKEPIVGIAEGAQFNVRWGFNETDPMMVWQYTMYAS